MANILNSLKNLVTPTIDVESRHKTEASAYNKVSNFLGEVRAKGLAKPNKFEVTIENPNVITNIAWGKQVSMYTDSAFFPLQRLITSRQQLFGLPSFHPVGIDLGGDNLGLNFIVDREMNVKRYFDSWMNSIVDRSTGLTRYEVEGYTPTYRTIITIKQLDEADNVTYAVKLLEAFPVAVNTLALDQNLPNVVHKLNVTFNYRRWVPVSIDQQSLPEFTKSTPESNLRITNGVIGMMSNRVSDLNPQQQAQELLSPGYNRAPDQTYFIVK